MLITGSNLLCGTVQNTNTVIIVDGHDVEDRSRSSTVGEFQGVPAI